MTTAGHGGMISHSTIAGHGGMTGRMTTAGRAEMIAHSTIAGHGGMTGRMTTAGRAEMIAHSTIAGHGGTTDRTTTAGHGGTTGRMTIAGHGGMTGRMTTAGHGGMTGRMTIAGRGGTTGRTTTVGRSERIATVVVHATGAMKAAEEQASEASAAIGLASGAATATIAPSRAAIVPRSHSASRSAGQAANGRLVPASGAAQAGRRSARSAITTEVALLAEMIRRSGHLARKQTRTKVSSR
jgi:hypothetical protein